jgi:hypothetical protein
MVEDINGKKMKKELNKMRWTWNGLYILPVILYTVYAWINPDGVGFGKTYNACYVISSKNRCLSK